MKPESPENPDVTPSAPKAGEYYVIIPVRKTIVGSRWFIIRYISPAPPGFYAELLAYNSCGTVIKTIFRKEYTFGYEYTFLPITEEQARDPVFLKWVALCYG